MKNSVRSFGVFASLASLFFLLATQALSAQQTDAPKNATTAAVTAEPQAAGQSVASPP